MTDFEEQATKLAECCRTRGIATNDFLMMDLSAWIDSISYRVYLLEKKAGESPETGVDVGLTADEAEQYYGGEAK